MTLIFNPFKVKFVNSCIIFFGSIKFGCIVAYSIFLQFKNNGNDNTTSFMHSCDHHLCILLRRPCFTFSTRASLVFLHFCNVQGALPNGLWRSTKCCQWILMYPKSLHHQVLSLKTLSLQALPSSEYQMTLNVPSPS